MAESTTAADVDSSDPLKSVADALETAFRAVKDGSNDATAAAENVLPAATRFVARLAYTTSYTLTFGVVFPSMMIARSIPADNAIIRGFADGAHDAIEKIDGMKPREVTSVNP